MLRVNILRVKFHIRNHGHGSSRSRCRINERLKSSVVTGKKRQVVPVVKEASPTKHIDPLSGLLPDRLLRRGSVRTLCMQDLRGLVRGQFRL